MLAKVCKVCNHIYKVSSYRCPLCNCDNSYTKNVPINTISNQGKRPLDKQEGGSHYKRFAIQPAEFNQKNKIPYCEANVIKYVCRHKDKNGREDILKAIHYLELLLEIEYEDK